MVKKKQSKSNKKKIKTTKKKGKVVRVKNKEERDDSMFSQGPMGSTLSLFGHKLFFGSKKKKK